MPLVLVVALMWWLTPPRPTQPAPLQTIVSNDNRRAAGQLRDGVLRVELEARMGTWYPEGPNGRTIDVAAFAEPGRALQDPGPLVRVPAGTEVRATVHNRLDTPMTLFGFGASVRGAADSAILAPGETRELRFVAKTPGTYYYAGKTKAKGPLISRIDEDTQLNGVIVVDPPGPVPADRIFAISWWFTIDSTSPSGLGRGTMTINGLSWPHTERLDMVQGDSAHWRLVNFTALDHPMHLHGFYFQMDAKGDGVRDTLYAPDQRRLAVTEILFPLQTMMLSWAATRPGNWIFHCHFAGHLSKLVSLDTYRGELDSSAAMHHMSDAPHQMYGLVLGIHVAARGAQPVSSEASRHLRLLVRQKPNVYGAHPGYAYVLGGTAAETSGVMNVPGPTLVLERGQPVSVTIVNQTRDHAAVHWHGIELASSYADGVPGWSGSANDILPAIPPGDSLTVRVTPPRAGTFMYHSHFNEFQQIPSGLYGAIVVLDRGHTYDPDTDRVLMFGDNGPTTNVITGPFALPMLNGDTQPPPLELRAGQRYRLRVINIRGDSPIQLSLTRGDTLVQWRAVAKDGADLPAGQSTLRPATLLSDPGEIYDFELTPGAPGLMRLRFGDPPNPGGPPPQVTTVEVRVR